jgi:NADH-ubiquinone oxidoreductase chain 6
MKTLFINLLALSALFCSVISITSKNPIVSVIYLISTFVLAAGYLILIGINFIGISYIVIYVGAIAILFLFVIMMINIKLSDILETGPQYNQNLPLAIAIGSVFIFIIFTLIPINFNNIPALSLLLDKITNINTNISNIIFDSKFYLLYLYLTVAIIMHETLAILFFDTKIFEFQQIEALGLGLYTYGAVLLIILSIILLLAMLAIIILSKSKSSKKSQLKSKK